jgi:exo-beta-1,3-glucanase (GH17 family)
MKINKFRNELLAVKFIEHSYSDKPKEIQNIASSSFLTGASIIEGRYKLVFDLLEDLAQLTEKQGHYIRTWSNGTDEYSPSSYDKNEIEDLVSRAFDLCYDN